VDTSSSPLLDLLMFMGLHVLAATAATLGYLLLLRTPRDEL
jgi:hypothetical protein